MESAPTVNNIPPSNPVGAHRVRPQRNKRYFHTKEAKMLAYISSNADNKIIRALEDEGFIVAPLPPFESLDAPTGTHADMLICAVGKALFKHADYALAGDFKNISEPMSGKYPHDVRLNIAIVGKHAICNEKHASREILKHLIEEGYTVRHVKQGYAHCSTCIVSENALITADEGIYAAATSLGIDALKIHSGHISLPPYDYGFIGGASGTSDSAVYFCGSLERHPDGEQIRAFITSHGKRVVELSPSPLADVGGILFI